jgi:ribosome biogenesis GTPase / thiamine phosphate phosphatase
VKVDREALEPWGWGPFFDEAVAAHGDRGDEPARVVAEHRIAIDVIAASGPVRATVTGRLFRAAKRGREIVPSVGDWVVLSSKSGGSPTVDAVLARKTKLSRKAAGEAEVEQLLAANVDVAFVVAGLDDAPNLSRIDRYLSLVRSGGVEPVVVLTKADLSVDPIGAGAHVESMSAGAAVHVVSQETGEGLAALERALVPGRTFVLLGPSGVGKSTLVNRWLGDAVMSVGGVRSDGKGRHTTSHRALMRMPGGALVIDTPGMRELALWDADPSGGDAFEDIAALAEGCRFRDCSHDAEPACAVRLAAEEGRLEMVRWRTFLKLAREARPRRRS